MEKPISFENHGQRLYGMLHLPEREGPAPAVALLHGFGGHRSESHFIFTKQARHLAQHGIAALRFDFRGSGESEGDFSEMTIEGEISDAVQALIFLAAQPEIDDTRLAVLGLSLGGCVAACLAGRDPRVKVLVLWSAPAQLLQVMATEAAARSDSLTPMGEGFDVGGLQVGPGFVNDVLTLQPLDKLRRFSGAALVVQGTDDKHVPLENANLYFNALPGPKQLKIMEGADHTFSSIAWEREVIAATTDWLEQHL